jgi:uncharacterized protein (DUF1015 family)
MVTMAKILPFKGVLYNPEKVGDLGNVVAPPYDVISEEQRQALEQLHPQNIVRLILSQGRPEDNESNNKYVRAATRFEKWQAEGALVRDTVSAMYLTVMDYVSDGVRHQRQGLIVLVELEDFSRGNIMPHEKTFSATKMDRFKLMEACRTNFSPIFSVFSDPHEGVFGPFRDWVNRVTPDFDFKDTGSSRHRLWRITDSDMHAEVSRKLEDRPLYIADGHHRYETALSYRDAMAAKAAQFDTHRGCNYVMMYLSSMQDPGLIIRPVHRMLSKITGDALNGFVGKAEDYFHVDTWEVSGDDYSGIKETLWAKVRAGARQRSIGVVIRGHPTAYVMAVKEGVMERLFGSEIPAALRRLDVTIVTKLIFQQILGLSDLELDDENRVLYTSRAENALKAVSSGKCPVALIVNPTRLSDVEEVSNARLIMPRKSTYFFPKVLSGLVINKLD